MPRQRRGHDHIIAHGYAVGLWGTMGRVWNFYEHLEPALAFGRAGRMGLGASGYCVVHAANEVRFVERDGRDVRTLYLAKGGNVDRAEGEADALARWLRGIDPSSSHYCPPDD